MKLSARDRDARARRDVHHLAELAGHRRGRLRRARARRASPASARRRRSSATTQSADSALAYLEELADELGDDPWALEEIEARLPREQRGRAAGDRRGAPRPAGQARGAAGLAAARASPRGAADVLDDLARRSRRHGARAPRRSRARFKRLKLKLGGRDGLDVERVQAVRGVTDAAADGRRERGLVAGRGARGAAAARGARGRVLRAAAPGRRSRRAGAEGALAAPDLRRRGLPRRRRRPRPAPTARTA